MRKIILEQKTPIVKPNIPIEADVISPDVFYNKTIEEIKSLVIWRGNKQIQLQEIFSISGDSDTIEHPDDLEIILKGKLSKFKRIAQKMSAGSMIIESSIGMHLGNQMSGGKISVKGDADDFAGAKMSGGELHINGNAGHYLGGSFRGDWRGMSGGHIKVSGNVKNECGNWMRKGLIEIDGNAGMFLGIHLHKGTIIVNGDVTDRAGAEMTGGILVINGKLHKLLPSFELAEEVDKISLDEIGEIKGPYLSFKGDFAERKQGLLYLKKKENSHLL